MQDKVLSIYIHIPFCQSKCHYCDFSSYSGKVHLFSDYFASLKKEIISYFYLRKRIIKSIFIGGGTPSLVPGEYIIDLVSFIKENFNVDNECEITIECNPNSLTANKIFQYDKSGINRISLGLQSSDNNILEIIGRTHIYSDFENSMNIIEKSRISNVNADIICGLPGQTTASLKNTLDKLIRFNIDHISVYSLIIENNTPMAEIKEKNPEIFPDEDTERDMYWMAVSELRKSGYNHYEISNFAKDNKECKHNIYCWEGNEYIGIGSGAHSYISGNRYANYDVPEKYIEGINTNAGVNNISETVSLGKEDKEKEFFLLGFRMLNGISENDFRIKFKTDFEKYKIIIDKLIKENLVEKKGDRFRLTNKGIDFANQVFVEFI